MIFAFLFVVIKNFPSTKCKLHYVDTLVLLVFFSSTIDWILKLLLYSSNNTLYTVYRNGEACEYRQTIRIYVIAIQCYCYIKAEIVDIKKQSYTF